MAYVTLEAEADIRKLQKAHLAAFWFGPLHLNCLLLAAPMHFQRAACSLPSSQQMLAAKQIFLA